MGQIGGHVSNVFMVVSSRAHRHSDSNLFREMTVLGACYGLFTKCLQKKRVGHSKREKVSQKYWFLAIFGVFVLCRGTSNTTFFLVVCVVIDVFFLGCNGLWVCREGARLEPVRIGLQNKRVWRKKQTMLWSSVRNFAGVGIKFSHIQHQFSEKKSECFLPCHECVFGGKWFVSLLCKCQTCGSGVYSQKNKEGPFNLSRGCLTR